VNDRVAYSRKDSKGRVLRKGESQREKYYIYQYRDMNNKRRVVYAKDLPELREKEKKINQDTDDGIDIYTGGNITLSVAFDKYIAGKLELKQSTKTNYKYMFDHYVRPALGNRKLMQIKYSDVKNFYYSLMQKYNFKPRSMEMVHTIIHPVFTMAVRDGIIRTNPSDGVMAEIKKSNACGNSKRHALTLEQQQAFMQYTAENPLYARWLPLFKVLLGTGCRIGEVIGLRWEDLDMKERLISINHNLIYGLQDSGTYEFYISTPKTQAGTRIIPMMEEVYRAFMQEKAYQKENGFNTLVIDGYTGFVFTNRFGNVHNPLTINRAIKRIYETYNEKEKVTAKEEKRPPVLIPHFSCHHFRHTFCTRFCENETNIKVIQEIMGHSDITTTMNIYAEVTEVKKKECMINLENKVRIM